MSTDCVYRLFTLNEHLAIDFVIYNKNCSQDN
jgi:hypothetical protein